MRRCSTTPDKIAATIYKVEGFINMPTPSAASPSPNFLKNRGVLRLKDSIAEGIGPKRWPDLFWTTL